MEGGVSTMGGGGGAEMAGLGPASQPFSLTLWALPIQP